MIHSVLFFALEAEKLPELEAVAFDGYLAGLCEAGWRGDERWPRLGYAASTALLFLQAGLVPLLTDESRHARWEQTMGCPIEEWADRWAQIYLLVVELEAEARQLMNAL